MCAWEEIHLQNPQMCLGLFVMVGLLIGVTVGNAGLGFLLGAVLGSINYAIFTKKHKAEDEVDTNKDA